MSEFAWLIEAPGPNYLGVVSIGQQHSFCWRPDHAKATRFYSEEQADAMMMAIRRACPELFAFAVLLGEAKAVEHGWLVTGEK